MFAESYGCWRVLSLCAAAGLIAASGRAEAQDCNLNGIDDSLEITPTVRLTEDFEGVGLPTGWNASGLWTITDTCADGFEPCDPTTTRWAYAGDTATCTYPLSTTSSLQSATFNRGLDRVVTVTYCVRSEMEESFDGVFVNILDSAGNTIAFGPFRAGTLNNGEWTTVTDTFTVPADASAVLRAEFTSFSDDFVAEGFGTQIDNVEISTQAVQDCNGDGVPDLCQVYDDRFFIDTFTFDLTFEGYTATGLWANNNTCGSEACEGGSASWVYFGSSSTCNFATGQAESGELRRTFTVPTGGAVLRYCSRYGGESGRFPGFTYPEPPVSGTFDAAGVYILDASDGSVLAFDDVSGDGDSLDWQRRQIDLSDFGDVPVELVFYFDSVDATSNTELGWQIDNVEVFRSGSVDRNDNGRIDICGENFVYNSDDQEVFSRLDSALSDSDYNPGDTIVLTPDAANTFQAVPKNVDADDVRLATLSSVTDLTIGPAGSVLVFDGANFESVGTVFLEGVVRVEQAATVELLDTFDITSGGSLTLSPGSSAFGGGDDINVSEGTVDLQAANLGGFQITLGSSFIQLPPVATLTGSGVIGVDFFSSPSDLTVFGDGEWVVRADTECFAPVTVTAGRITIQNGTLTLFGGLINNGGTIVGDLAGASARGSSAPGAAVFGDLVLSQDSSLLLTGSAARLRLADNADIAINDNTRFDLSQAALQLVGNGNNQTLELLSQDIGPDLAAYDRATPNQFPIRELRVGPTRAAVTLVDNRDNANDGQGLCEALYVERLVIDGQATLNTGGCKIYYQELVLNGSVDDPGNLVQVSITNACNAADLDQDGDNDLIDAFAFLDAYNPADPSEQADLDNNGTNDLVDAFAFLDAYDTVACPANN